MAYPFEETPLRVTAGLAISGASFRDTTGLASLNLGLEKQWHRHDLNLDLLFSGDYDDSRDYNVVRPHLQSTVVFRRHLNADWNLFIDHLTSLNEDTFASDNNDEDTALLVPTLLGAGLNLWRGKKATSFQEIQLGAGARYQYDDVDFTERRNLVEPVIGVVYRAQEAPF